MQLCHFFVSRFLFLPLFGGFLFCCEIMVARSVLSQEMDPQELQQKILQMQQEEREQNIQKEMFRQAARDLKQYIEDLLQKGFAHRELIQSGQMVVRGREMKHRNGSPMVPDVSRKITFAFDKNRTRVDQIIDTQDYSDCAGGCFGCYKGDTRLVESEKALYSLRFRFPVRLINVIICNAFRQNIALYAKYIADSIQLPFPISRSRLRQYFQ